MQFLICLWPSGPPFTQAFSQQLMTVWFYKLKAVHLSTCFCIVLVCLHCVDPTRDKALVPWWLYDTALHSGPTSKVEKFKLYELCHVFQHDTVFSMLIILLSWITEHMLQFASVPKQTPSLKKMPTVGKLGKSASPLEMNFMLLQCRGIPFPSMESLSKEKPNKI